MMNSPSAEILGDEELVNSVLEAARTSMGMDISPLDLINVDVSLFHSHREGTFLLASISLQQFASRVTSLVQFRTELQEYLRGRMTDCAPNLAALVGEQVDYSQILRSDFAF